MPQTEIETYKSSRQYYLATTLIGKTRDSISTEYTFFSPIRKIINISNKYYWCHISPTRHYLQ